MAQLDDAYDFADACRSDSMYDEDVDQLPNYFRSWVRVALTGRYAGNAAEVVSKLADLEAAQKQLLKVYERAIASLTHKADSSDDDGTANRLKCFREARERLDAASNALQRILARLKDIASRE